VVIKKVMLCPWFGPLPEWMPLYQENVRRSIDNSYEFLIFTDLEQFKERVRETLGIRCPIEPGTGKIHDYRAAFGVIFAEEIKGYDFWGHTDFDCVYGRVERWLTDEVLDGLDIWSNHWSYICGPWTLYRNTDAVNKLFLKHLLWRGILEDPQISGWVETEFTRVVNASNARVVYDCQQVWQKPDLAHVRLDGERLLIGDKELFMAHFRHTKTYPEGCR
jgi:hypothetical protein